MTSPKDYPCWRVKLLIICVMFMILITICSVKRQYLNFTHSFFLQIIFQNSTTKYDQQRSNSSQDANSTIWVQYINPVSCNKDLANFDIQFLHNRFFVLISFFCLILICAFNSALIIQPFMPFLYLCKIYFHIYLQFINMFISHIIF